MKNEKPEITVKSIKQMDGRDGYIFSASVYVDGVRAFSVHNDGCGAENWYDTFNEEGKRLLKVCEEYAKTLPQWITKYGSYDMDLDILLEDIIADAQEKKQIKRWCRTKTVFRLPESKQGAYQTINRKFDEVIKKHVLDKYPTAIIMNETI